jgi:NAD-dependent deacetylase
VPGKVLDLRTSINFPLMRLISSTDRIFILAGAGVSAESGIPTFRGVGGLWRNYRIEEVASPEAWHRDPRLVWEFYSMRRRVASAAKPNPAHFALAKIEENLKDRLFVCTQNVDNLHEQAGSRNIVHMHGELFKSRCDTCSRPPFDDTNLYDPPAELPCANAEAGFARTSAGLAKCRLNWVESTTRWSDARSSLLSEYQAWSSPLPSFVAQVKGRARTIYVGPEEPANVSSFTESHLGKASECPRYWLVVGIDTRNYLIPCRWLANATILLYL